MPDEGVTGSQKPDEGVTGSQKPDKGVTGSQKPDEGFTGNQMEFLGSRSSGRRQSYGGDDIPGV